MSKDLLHSWANAGPVIGTAVVCPHCGTSTTPLGLRDASVTDRISGRTMPVTSVFACGSCHYPFIWIRADERFIPAPRIGATLAKVPVDLQRLYDEARDASGAGAYTGCAMLARKALMNLAVLEGAESKQSFQFYVNFLAESGFVPKKGKPWVDKIRKKGNEATHEVEFVTEGEARELMYLLENLFRFNFEMVDSEPPAATSGA